MGGVLGGILGGVSRQIGKVFGLVSHHEIFTDIQVSNLLTPGKADSFARKNAKHQAFGNHGDYFHNYRGWQREYRKKYSKKFLENLGYAPTSTASTQVPNDTTIEAELTSLGYDVSTIISARNQIMDLDDKKDYYLMGHTQLNGFDPFTGVYAVGGKNYVLHSYVAGATDNDLDVTWRRDHEDAIIENLIANYSYDEINNTVAIDTFTYTVGSLDSTVYDSSGASIYRNVYRTICTHPTEPDVVIETPVEYLYVTDSDPMYSQEVLWIRYRTTDTVTRYYAEPVVDAGRLYITGEVDITAIIPLKVDNSMVDLDSRKLDRMLRRLNLSGEDLRESIENPDMDSAYLMTGIDPTVSDVPAIDKTVFQMFDLMSPGSGNVNISIDQLSMKYSFEVVKTVETGVIADVGKYIKENTGSSTMLLKYQINSTEYRQLSISEFSQTYTVSGHGFTSDFGSSAGLCRLVIPLDIYNGLSYKEFVEVYERSLCLLAYSMEVVKVKWYETSAFGSILKIVGIALLVIGVGGVLLAISQGITMFAATTTLAATIASSLGTTLSLGALMAVAVLELVVVSAVSSAALSYLAEKVGGATGALLAAIGTLVVTYYGANGASTSFTASQWMMAANNALSTYTQWIGHQTENVMNSIEDYMSIMGAKIEDLESKLEEFENDVSRGFSDLIGEPNSIYNTIERMCSSITTTDVSNLVDYGTQIEYAINVRTNVVSGIG